MMRNAGICVILCGLFIGISCHTKNDVAGGTDRLLLSADPQQISAGGSSTLSVTGTDENGLPLPDGTTVSFAVDKSGRVSPSSIQLVGGFASTKYFATLAPGEITVTATSGSVQAQVSITVADTIAQKVFVTANPDTFPSGGGTSVVTAIVTDTSSQPLEGVDVRFSTTTGTLQSGGDIMQTNSNGIVSDVLNTNESATVTATSGDGFSGQTTITVGLGQIVCHLTVDNAHVSVGTSVHFFDTSDPGGNEITQYHWDFDDTSSANGQNVQHAYSRAGTFNVVHSITDSRNQTYFCDPFPIEVTQ